MFVAVLVAVAAAILDIVFPATPAGADYAQRLLAIQGAEAHATPSQLAAVIKWHGEFRSGVLLLAGVVFVFVGDLLSRMVRTQAPRTGDRQGPAV
jgi:hypothetical protein